MTRNHPIGLSLSILLLAASLAQAQQASDPIWTTEPTHVDPAKQTYQRLPAKLVARDTRVWITVPQRIKVLDSRSFSVGEVVYEFDSLRPVGNKRICQAVEGGRWACGRMASIFLGNLVRGKRLLCDVVQGDKRVGLRHCVIGATDVASAIVSQGYGMAVEDPSLLAAQAEAQKLGAKGLWRNPKCAASFDTC